MFSFHYDGPRFVLCTLPRCLVMPASTDT